VSVRYRCSSCAEALAYMLGGPAALLLCDVLCARVLTCALLSMAVWYTSGTAVRLCTIVEHVICDPRQLYCVVFLSAVLLCHFSSGSDSVGVPQTCALVCIGSAYSRIMLQSAQYCSGRSFCCRPYHTKSAGVGQSLCSVYRHQRPPDISSQLATLFPVRSSAFSAL